MAFSSASMRSKRSCISVRSSLTSCRSLPISWRIIWSGVGSASPKRLTTFITAPSTLPVMMTVLKAPTSVSVSMPETAVSKPWGESAI